MKTLQLSHMAERNQVWVMLLVEHSLVTALPHVSWVAELLETGAQPFLKEGASEEHTNPAPLCSPLASEI